MAIPERRMNQLFLAMFGLTSVAFAMSNGPRRRAWAPIIGLLGQPFWAAFAYESGGWGLGLLVAAYTVVYVRAICANGRGHGQR